MQKKKLNIEIVLEGVDYQSGKSFVIKFIDPKTNDFKMVRFTEKTS